MLRIIRDLKDIISDGPNENIAYAEPQDGYPLVVKACIIGPKSTPYEGNIFEVKIQFPDNYPVKNPNFFLNQLVHLILFLDFTTYSYIYWTNGSS
jgi:ubiquitin-protein ligase